MIKYLIHRIYQSSVKTVEEEPTVPHWKNTWLQVKVLHSNIVQEQNAPQVSRVKVLVMAPVSVIFTDLG